VAAVREQTLEEYPEIRGALAELGGKISDAEMRQLNYAVDGQKKDVKQVVADFVRSKGL
jgi:osmoprotectant transport system substrate-binding protein